jgi:predicted Zn-dependent peptidase
METNPKKSLMSKEPICLTLSNGIRLVHMRVPNQVAHLGFFFAAGSRFESLQQMGLAHFIEHCVFKGTEKRKAYHILSRIDAVGGELNAYTAKEELCLYASFSKKYTARAAELLADIAIRSNFPEKELEKEKEVIIDELNSYMDSPSDRIFDDFEARLFKGHSLGYNILGTKKSVQRFKPEDLRKFTKAYFTCDNLVVSYVGSMTADKLSALLENHLSEMPLTGNRPSIQEFSDYQPFEHREKEANFQAHAIFGSIGPGYHDSNRIAMALLINVLGGPALNSRLNLSVREKYGLAYSVEASYHTYADTGYWQVYLGTESKNLEKAQSLVFKELDRLRNESFSTVQLHRAKEQLKGQLALGMDSNSGIMQGLGKSMLVFNQIDTLAEIHASIDKITTTQLVELSQKYFAPNQRSILVYDC